MQRVQPFQHHSDAYLAFAGVKLRAVGVVYFLFDCEADSFLSKWKQKKENTYDTMKVL